MKNSFNALLMVSLSLFSSAALTNNLKPVGETTAYWGMFIPVYDAKLSVAPQTNKLNLLSDQTAIELELCYRTSLTAENFVEAAEKALPESLTEAHQQAVNKLHQSYKGVSDDDCYQLSYDPEVGTQLKLNQTVKFTDNTPGFKAVYFGIWLGEQPLSNKVKLDLINQL